MKNYITLIIFCSVFILFDSFAQDCSDPYSISNISGNNADVLLGIGDLWFDGAQGRYFFPKRDPGQGVSAFLAGAYWIGAKDEADNLKLTAQKYERAQGKTSYWAGPGYDVSDCANWDNQYRIKKEDLDKFLADLADGSIDDEIPFAILGWPGKANPHFMDLYGFEMPNISMAPFVDNDQDGIYDPDKGDYPNTLEAAEVVFWIMNDYSGNSQFDPPKTSIATTAYSFKDENDIALNNSTVYNVQIVNKSETTLKDFIFSLWYDPSLGCPYDDYYGCLPEKDLAFIYNQDVEDGDFGCSCSGGIFTYCQNIPIMGVKLIRNGLNVQDGEVMNNYLMYNRASGQMQNTLSPVTAQEHYNNMQGLWRDGDPIIQNAAITNFMFPGNPADGEEYTMCSASIINQDINVVTSYKPVDLPPGAQYELSFAVTGIESVAHPCPDVNPLVEATDRLKEKFLEKLQISTSNKRLIATDGLSIQPNPFKGIGKLILKDENTQIKEVWIYNSLGQLIQHSNALNTNVYPINSQNFDKGLHFIKLKTHNSDLYSTKVMVQ